VWMCLCRWVHSCL